MKSGKKLFILLLMPAASAFAEDDIAGVLFHHILNGDTFQPFFFLHALKLPFGLTVHHLMLLLAAGLVLLGFLLGARKRDLKSKGLTVVLEALVLFVRDDIVYPIMGSKRGEKWLPFFSTLFIFLLTVNFLGLIPAFKSATGNITVTSAFAALILLLTLGTGLKSLGLQKFFKNLYPEGAVLPIGLFVALLEFAGIFIKSLVLSLRLFANMFAGHLAILSFLVLMFVLSPLFGVVSVPFSLFTYALEVLVALIQALVFTLLSCIFITMASSAHE